MLGVKASSAATATLASIGMVHMIRKWQGSLLQPRPSKQGEVRGDRRLISLKQVADILVIQPPGKDFGRKKSFGQSG
jgi:hypothetical protein